MRLGCAGGKPVLLRDGGAFDLSGVASTMAELLRSWEVALHAVERGVHPPVDLRRAPLQAPVPRPGKIIGAPVNYRDHAREMGVTGTMAELGVFLKAPTSVLGPDGTVRLPYTDRRTDQEAELAAVIGRQCRNVPVGEALGAVIGYTCLLDITVRGGEDRSNRKSFDTFTPMGPWIVTGDEVRNPSDLRLRCWVNDELRQDAWTGDLVFGVAEIVSYASSVMTLEPGDVIATGTPAGVGPLADGDRIAIEIERVGRLEVGVTAAHAVPWAAVRPRPALLD